MKHRVTCAISIATICFTILSACGNSREIAACQSAISGRLKSPLTAQFSEIVATKAPASADRLKVIYDLAKRQEATNTNDVIAVEAARTANNYSAASEIENRLKKSRDSLNWFFQAHYALGDYQKNPITLVEMAVDAQNGFGAIGRIDTLCAVNNSGAVTILQMRQRE